MPYFFPSAHETKETGYAQEFQETEKFGESDDPQDPGGLEQGGRDLALTQQNDAVVKREGGAEVYHKPRLQVPFCHNLWIQDDLCVYHCVCEVEMYGIGGSYIRS